MNHTTIQPGDHFSHERVIAFADTDMSGRVHFTMILRYVEEAEHAFFSSIGEQVIGDHHGWPRANVQCDYCAPLHFSEVVTVTIRVTNVGNTSVKYEFSIKNTHRVCAQGSMVIVRVSERAT